ncbi:PAS domain S-box protein [Alicyclobacillus sp. SO9]|uniref:PAS domain-containing protein n=1 Tax=Alicyclobacillus sp. SO9 TaxID=2665646 RepID=UPI0018E70691|nr:PAS domain S-box protein [Alicyclobacillus sp. SO9]QQE79875.1 PAS domain S-box protein [Alicyclobacillus sp. SO9]
MKRSLLRQRIILSIRTLVLVAVLELMNELGDETVLAHWNIPVGTLKLHIVKLSVAVAFAIPVVLLWISQEYRNLKRADMELEQSQQDYRSLFDHNTDGVYLLNERGEFCNANPSFLEMTGYSLDELKNKPRLDFSDESNRLEMLEHLRRAQAGESSRYQARFVRKDKRSSVDLNITYFPMYRNGRLAGSYSIVQDVTEKNRAEEELRETKNMLTSLIDNTTDIIAIYDAKGTILSVNRGFVQTFQYDELEIVGGSVYDLVPQSWMDDMKTTVANVLNNKMVVSRDALRVTKTGNFVEIDLTISPITNAKGDVVAIASIGRDVTVDKRLKRELDEMHSRLESLVQNTADAISFLDVQGRVILVNPAWEQLYGWQFAEVKGQIPATMTEMFRSVLTREESFTKELVVQRKDKSQVTVSATGSPIYSSDGTVTGVSFISKDLTQQKQAEEVFLNAEKMQLVASLAAGIAHEIRNPLTSVSGFLELMKSNCEIKYLDLLQSEVSRINEITNEFLLLAKPQAQAQSYEDLTQVLHEVLTLMGSQTHMHSISVHINRAESLPRVACVKAHMKQVFINIIKNAVEAMEDGGTLYIDFSHNGAGVSVDIVDDGAGISEETLQKIGQPFYTTKERGTGLGLMVTYRIVENHGGTIHISSTLGQGTKVRLYLPESGCMQNLESSAIAAGVV